MPAQTTAQALIEFRSELRAAGLDWELIDDLVRDAARTIVAKDGLCTKPVKVATTRFTGLPQASEGVGESKSPA
ncbi:hypothetical protein [Streptomyces scabiei]|uniref:hypothetical protein n=1 Tax=Streptomyces scabiei TaxID=1930 RepID=UPI001B301097|nr:MULTISPECIES: hypothetical protein [Streptomyces]MDX3199943.1 hypothetical protein [Streptomyces scabiei]MDX3217737.1 hypothetical protein [Streptomyces scabiei]QTU64231.1 hypothetical protein F3K22_27330 [Streptomyces sp. LBUM 1475]